MEETHILVLSKTHENTEKWECPVCGRVLLIEWFPFHRVIVETGDKYAKHTASKGLSLGQRAER